MSQGARFGALGRLCEAAVAQETVPGLVVLVGAGGRTLYHEAFGERQVTPRHLPATADTVYDVSSLTKAVVTSVLTMRLVEQGKLALDERVARRLPEFQGRGKSRVTLRHLLAHASGLPAHRPLWKTASGAASERWAIALLAAHEPLEHDPGTRSVYSDLGFITLGWLLERTAGLRLDVQADRAVFQPLGLASTTFVNLADSEARARLLANRAVAATERCPERKRVVIGEVDDLNAWAMGGIAGHAGLFSTAADLGTIAASLCLAWKGSPVPAPVGKSVLREFWSPAGIPGSTWRLGWDGPSGKGSLAGDRLSRAAVGHLGFTGCSLWIDPERETWVVVLSNRIHPEITQNEALRTLRPALNDAALEAVGY